jgi:hypothetical protein
MMLSLEKKPGMEMRELPRFVLWNKEADTNRCHRRFKTDARAQGMSFFEPPRARRSRGETTKDAKGLTRPAAGTKALSCGAFPTHPSPPQERMLVTQDEIQEGRKTGKQE